MTKQRDWHNDMELLQKKPKFTIDEVNHIIYNIAPYWLQQYAVEKERADQAESELEAAYNEVDKLQKEYARLDETAANDFDQLTAAEAREKKLREAIEAMMPGMWDGMRVHFQIVLESLYPDKEEEAK